MRLVGFLAFALAALATGNAAASALGPVLDGIEWGEPSDALARHFGSRALKLARPIEFGDAYVDVALRDQMLGGYPFTVYFQMDKETRRLKRIMFERQRHGANPMVFRAVLAALQGDYGPPNADCAHPATRRNGYQAAGERVWQAGGDAIYAVFNDGTLEAEEGCTLSVNVPCGVTGHLYVQIVPHRADAPLCR
jgi:hypothetical protein